MKVINTRPLQDAEPFAAAIRAAGAEPVSSPVLTIRFRDDPVTVEPDEALAFTSANGVRAFARANPDRRAFVFAVGVATASAARAAGFTAVEAAKGDVGSLVELIAASKPQRPVLHLAGSDRAGDLVAALGALGLAARRLALYDAAPEPFLAAPARAVLDLEPANCAVGLFSPRSAQIFWDQTLRAGLEKRLVEVRLLAFSAAVAAAAQPGRWGAVLIARERTSAAMAALIRA